MGLQSKTVNSYKWSFLAELASSLVVPIVYIINAKLLKPEDFGIVTAATILISFSQIIWGAGFSKALIQKQERISESSNIVFWSNLGFGFLLFILLFLFAPFIAGVFKDNRLLAVIKVLSFLILLGSFSSVQLTLLQKEFQFKKIFWIRVLTVALPGMTSIPLAYFGFNYWALVYGSLMGQIAQTILLWLVSDWRPKFYFDFTLFKEFWKFGAFVMLSGMSAWFYSWADSMIVGLYFDSQHLGIYRTGNFFATMAFGLFFAPLIPVLYSAFSKISKDRERLKLKHEIVVKLLAIISLPIGFGLFAIQDHIATVFFGVHWEGIALIIGTLGLAHSISWIVGANGEIYRAIGRPDIETKVVSYTIFFYLAAYLVSIQYGMKYFIWTRFTLTCLAMFVSFYFAKKILQFPVLNWFKLTISPFVASFIMYAIINNLKGSVSVNVSGMLLLILAGICIYLILIFLLEQKFIKNEIFTIFKSSEG